MRVYLKAPSNLGRAIHRITAALMRHAPEWVEEVQTPEEADLRVWMVLGAGERTPILQTRQPYAVWQLTLRTSEHPHTSAWLEVWQRAALTVSYYDLPALLAEDAVVAPPFRFMHAPLGLDPAFSPLVPEIGKSFLVGTSGYIAATEGIVEWNLAKGPAQAFHLGPHLRETPRDSWLCVTNIDDEILAGAWAQCQYVAAMRRIEGFEFPGIEGLVCGARPVCFDRPHYRQWYGELADYVREGTVDEVVEDLRCLIGKPYRAVTHAERLYAAAKFDWATICRGFWERLEGSVR